MLWTSPPVGSQRNLSGSGEVLAGVQWTFHLASSSASSGLARDSIAEGVRGSVPTWFGPSQNHHHAIPHPWKVPGQARYIPRPHPICQVSRPNLPISTQAFASVVALFPGKRRYILFLFISPFHFNIQRSRVFSLLIIPSVHRIHSRFATDDPRPPTISVDPTSQSTSAPHPKSHGTLLRPP